MERNKREKLSVFISLVLRHQPEAAGIRLNENGWADVDELIDGINNIGRYLDIQILEEIVSTDNKGRYSISHDKKLIRANQGHSITVDVELRQADPPAILYHGTASRFLDAISIEGIKPMSRLYVHLSKDCDTAVNVGKRHGEVVVLEVNATLMCQDGRTFYLSENGLWLTEYVAPKYLTVVEQ